MLRLFLANINDYRDELLNSLTNEQIQKAHKYKKEDDYKRSVLSSYLLNYVLYFHQVKNKNIVYNLYNKPYLESKEIFFNISHSKDYVICAASKFDLGVDIEYVRPMNQLVIDKCFSEDEKNFIKTDEEFTKVWTLKESYLKMLGCGVSSKLNSFSVIKNNEVTCIDDYNLISFKLDNYHLSVCYKKHEKLQINYLKIEISLT